MYKYFFFVLPCAFNSTLQTYTMYAYNICCSRVGRNFIYTIGNEIIPCMHTLCDVCTCMYMFIVYKIVIRSLKKKFYFCENIVLFFCVFENGDYISGTTAEDINSCLNSVKLILV